jgi:sporulation-control protein spo0M
VNRSQDNEMREVIATYDDGIGTMEVGIPSRILHRRTPLEYVVRLTSTSGSYQGEPVHLKFTTQYHTETGHKTVTLSQGSLAEKLRISRGLSERHEGSVCVPEKLPSTIGSTDVWLTIVIGEEFRQKAHVHTTPHRLIQKGIESLTEVGFTVRDGVCVSDPRSNQNSFLQRIGFRPATADCESDNVDLLVQFREQGASLFGSVVSERPRSETIKSMQDFELLARTEIDTLVSEGLEEFAERVAPTIC